MNCPLINTTFQNKYPFLSSAEVEQLMKITKVREIATKGSILAAGEPSTFIYFIVKGMTRGYFTEESGEQRTVFLFLPHTVFGPPGILDGETTSKFTYVAIEKTILIEFPFAEFIQLTETKMPYARLWTEILKDNLRTLVFRVELLAVKTPEERYDILMKRQPQLFQSAYHKYIANYLGITPNSLSRIIKRKTITRN
jgi:CRP-like cAMP-binding protein